MQRQGGHCRLVGGHLHTYAELLGLEADWRPSCRMNERPPEELGKTRAELNAN